MLKVAVVEDDNFLLQTLNLILQKNDNINVIGLFSNPIDALTSIPTLKPDIVLMDLNHGSQHISGIECITRLKISNP